MRPGEEFRETDPLCHSSPTFVAITTFSRCPLCSIAFPTISSETPKPYTGAVSIRLIPLSSAAWIVRIDSVSSVPPHIQPPMAQVPSATREPVRFVPLIGMNSMESSCIAPSGDRLSCFHQRFHQRYCAVAASWLGRAIRRHPCCSPKCLRPEESAKCKRRGRGGLL